MAQSDDLIPSLPVDVSPRLVLAEHFSDDCAALPIRGGWGFTKEDAVIIDKDDPSVDPRVPFDGVGVEYLFVEKRIFLEFIVFEKLEDISLPTGWHLIEQKVIGDRHRIYDWLEFELNVVDMNALGHENEMGFMQQLMECGTRFTREYWFDVTSFYGR